MTDEELCGALTARLLFMTRGGINDDVVVAHRPGEGDANSFMAQFRLWGVGDPLVVCIWASDRHLHVFVNGACILFADAAGLSSNARELWNAVRGIQVGGAMPDAVRARQQLVEALSGGAA